MIIEGVKGACDHWGSEGEGHVIIGGSEGGGACDHWGSEGRGM